jgi:hypothetical protein
MTSTPHQMLRDFLHEAGYRVLFRKRGWIECLVSSGQERWIGREATEEQALRDALRQMFPSGAARDLLERGLSARTEVDVSTLAESSARLSTRPPPADSGTEEAPAAAAEPALKEPVAVESPPTARKASDAPKVAPKPAAATKAAAEEPVVVPRSAAVDLDPTAPESVAQTARKFASSPETVRGGSAPPSWVPPSPPDPVAATQPASGLDAFSSTPTLRQQHGGGAGERKSHLRVKGAVQAIESLIGGIDADDKRLAAMSPQRLRLWVLYWICHARSYEETLPDEVDVARAVARVAKRLTELCKRFWPGNIRALQLHARPGEAGVGGPAATWREAEAMARGLLEDHLKQGPKNGLDADGWSDAASLLPRPADPPAMLAEIAEIVQRVTGPLDGSPDFMSGRDAERTSGRDAAERTSGRDAAERTSGRDAAERTSGRDAAAERTLQPTDAVLDELAVVTQKLRWLRGSADPEKWGLLMGRLRWLAQEVGGRGARLKSLLDPLHQPATPWAALFATEGEDPQQVEAVTDLLTGKPGPGTDREALAAWIVKALDVLDTAQIAMVLHPVRSEVRDIDPASLPAPGRRVRRRFRDLIARLPHSDEGLGPPRSTPSSPLAQWSAALFGPDSQAKASSPEPSVRDTANSERTSVGEAKPSVREPAERTSRDAAVDATSPDRTPRGATSTPDPLSTDWASRPRSPG